MPEDIRKTAILEFAIDQTQAQKQLVQTEKNINSLKKEQAELNKEYKAGKISEDQYIESNLKLQRAIKSETTQKQSLNKLLETESNSRNAMRARVAALNTEYNNLNLTTAKGAKRADELQKELSQLNAELNKGSKAAGQFKDNIGNYPEKLGEGVKAINVAGTSVGDLTSKFKGFINPVTAAVGIVGALGTAYANSATGAKDLAFATSTLSAATALASESFAKMISSSEEGEGIISKLVSGILFNLSPSLAIAANEMARVEEQLKRLDTARAFAAGFAKEDERRAELLRRIRDDEEKSLQERLEASKQIDAILESSQGRTTAVIQAQIAGIKQSTIGYEKNLEAQLQVANLTAEIADKEEEITGKLTENVKARQTIATEIQALARATQRATSGGEPGASGDPLQGTFSIGETGKEQELEMTERFNQRIVEAEEEKNAQILRDKQRAAEGQMKIDQMLADNQINAAIGITGAIASVLDQQGEAFKAFATAQTLISTYSTAQKAYEAAFVPPTVASPILAATNVALAIAQGLANVAAIHGVQFAEGGYTGPGDKYDIAGIVHKDEYVVNKSTRQRPEAQPHLMALERMRLGQYADGGLVTNSISTPINQQLELANIVKNMPAPVVGVKEVTKMQNRVRVKEQASKR